MKLQIGMKQRPLEELDETTAPRRIRRDKCSNIANQLIGFYMMGNNGR